MERAHNLPPPPRDPGRWYQGWPVPFTILWPDYPEGKPDWTTADPIRHRRCLDLHLCGVCGQKLDIHNIVFIGGCHGLDPLGPGKDAVAFFDPPMHEECAKYSAEVCPYLGVGRVRADLGDSGVQYLWYADGILRLNRELTRFRTLKKVVTLEKTKP